MRNVKTREGFEYWDKICSLKHYGFLHSPDGKRVVKTEGIGNWIDKFEAQEIVDQAQDEINQYRAERDALQQRLTEADERADVMESRVAAISSVALAVKFALEGNGTIGWEDRCAKMIGDLYQEAALKPAEAPKCERCGCSTVETCDERGCGYLGAGNGAPE